MRRPKDTRHVCLVRAHTSPCLPFPFRGHLGTRVQQRLSCKSFVAVALRLEDVLRSLSGVHVPVTTPILSRGARRRRPRSPSSRSSLVPFFTPAATRLWQVPLFYFFFYISFSSFIICAASTSRDRPPRVRPNAYFYSTLAVTSVSPASLIPGRPSPQRLRYHIMSHTACLSCRRRRRPPLSSRSRLGSGGPSRRRSSVSFMPTVYRSRLFFIAPPPFTHYSFFLSFSLCLLSLSLSLSPYPYPISCVSLFAGLTSMLLWGL